MKMRGYTNNPVEISFAGTIREDSADVEMDVIFVGPSGEFPVPAFRAGGNAFRVRFSSPNPGRYTYRTICSSDVGLDGLAGELEIEPYDGENDLYRHGPLRVAANRRTLEHSDGTPFFWLGDTWWMGLTKRLDWPHGFASLAADRVAKGFNLIQIVAGPLPDFDAEDATWHPQQANEGGWPWEQGWARINPEFYDLADRRIQYLVDHGLVPCIVAMWGFYLPFMGIERVKQHWRNLVARYGAYPVVWCLCGEIELPTYSHLANTDALEAEKAAQIAGWTEVARYVRALDPYRRILTVHPAWAQSGRDAIADESLIDLDLLQTSHGGHAILGRTMDRVNASNARTPRMPVVNGEPCYEGIMGTAWQEMQRFVFWTSVMSGSAGHTYGAQGIWAMSSRDEPFVGSTMNWGEGFWQDVMHYPGSAQVGLGRRFLERYPWWLFEPRPDQLAIGIPGKLKIFYLAGQWVDPKFAGVRDKRIEIEPDIQYRAYFFDPRTGADVAVGPVEPDADGTWPVPRKPTMDDWVLVLDGT
ncbi:MAG: DUF4038 domain-containing protein [Armatimonadetes bacterium]|nr:DUF4038 domain-containing protein [Armatimonadota bacterium]